MTRQFVDRFGRPITDPAVIEYRTMKTQLRRLTAINRKTAADWCKVVTIGELAKAMKATPHHVLEVMRGGHLIGLIEEGSLENWWIYEDGE